MDGALKIAAVAVFSAILAVVVKKDVRELGLVLALTAGLLILTFALDAIREIRAVMDTLSELAGLSPAVLSPVVKTVGIAIISKVSAEICRDAGEGGIGAFVETTGAALALAAALPLLEAVLALITDLV